ncbi:MAG: hypothetical protein IJ060_05560 [Oscillospiraceae bacterium]|nr:hypothetical protein [Oscillospiraceae bacterium]
MLKKLIRIKDNIFYSPSHNTFFRLEPTEQVDFSDFLLEISGHEEKIFEFLICNYNNYVTKEELECEFPECADPYDKTLDRLRRDKIEGKLKVYGLIKKANGRAILYLSESPFSAEDTGKTADTPLLSRENYYVDYDTILSDCAPDNAAAPQSILHKWIDECAALPRFDARCMMLLERIGFLPAFGRKPDKKWFLAEAKKLIYRFDESEILDYGGTELLIFARSVLFGVIEYIEAQLQIIIPETGNADLQKQFATMLRRFQTITVPEGKAVNPLLLVVYYDYYGLVYYRNYLFTRSQEHLAAATDVTEKALQNARKVDMHLQIWAAFLTYNLGRLYCEQGEYDKSLRNIETAVILRQGLADSPFFSEALKHDLYFEYLLARIRQTEISQRAGVLTPEKAQAEYRMIYEEADAAYNQNDSGDTQPYILRLLDERMPG